MDLAIISTIHNLDYSDHGDIFLCLAPLAIKHKKYREYFKKKSVAGKHVILDNGVAEGIKINPVAYIEVAKYIKPTEIILPDVLYDDQRTIKETSFFLRNFDKLLRSLNIKTIGVIQGKNLSKAYNILEHYLEHDSIDIIALPFAGLDFFKFRGISNTQRNALARIHFLRNIKASYNIHKSIHLLGLYNPYELKFYRDEFEVRSCDSSSPVAHGAKNIKFDEYGLFEKDGSLDHNKKISSKYKEDIEYNIKKLKEFANGINV